jgi:RHS repeat-associated protein
MEFLAVFALLLVTPFATPAHALHADRQGSVIAVTAQATGELVARYQYDAFGQRSQTISLVTQDMGFTGREYDAESGLYHYRARAYDPAVGRFLQSDPLGFAAGDLNLYAYTWNDPANWTDPSGLSAERTYAAMQAFAIASEAKPEVQAIGLATICLAGRGIADVLEGIGEVLANGGDFSQIETAQVSECAAMVFAPVLSPGCGCGKGKGAGGGRAGGNSFPAGTPVLTPSGPVAIESLREGDLVVARDEATGVSGVFPVTALMGREARDVLWLTLERGDGVVSRMGVTSAHPLFVAGDGWTQAADIAPGDVVRDKDLAALTVLAVEVDPRPQIVHNLEVAGAATYFAGELEAWGHNGLGYYVIKFASGAKYVGKGCAQRMQRSARRLARRDNDPVVSMTHFPASSNRDSFIGEHQSMCDLGWKGKRIPNLKNEISSPGAKF